jgi:hypothetical protein
MAKGAWTSNATHRQVRLLKSHVRGKALTHGSVVGAGRPTGPLTVIISQCELSYNPVFNK